MSKKSYIRIGVLLVLGGAINWAAHAVHNADLILSDAFVVGVLSNLVATLIFLLLSYGWKHLKRISLLSQPPGWNLRRFAELCFSRKTFTQVLEPALSDMQKEHFEALAAGRRWKARMVLVRGYWSFWSAVAAQLPISFARRVYEVWKATKTGS